MLSLRRQNAGRIIHQIGQLRYGERLLLAQIFSLAVCSVILCALPKPYGAGIGVRVSYSVMEGNAPDTFELTRAG